MSSALRISEIFCSLQGEASTVGRPTVFIRLTGCPLRCQYCDTAYAFSGGTIMQLEDILRDVATYGVLLVTVTGGEPLAQKNCLPLLKELCDSGYEVSLETAGALDISGVDKRVSKVMDLKTPGSDEATRNMESNINFLNKHDQVKFVICDREDYEWAKNKVENLQLFTLVDEVLFSPSRTQLSGTDLANWIVEDRLPVRFQIQLHKTLWDDVPGK